MTPKWLDPNWAPSRDWSADDRLEVVAACCELIQRDVYRGTYSEPGRPNFTSIAHVMYEDAAVLESARSSMIEVLRMARAEHQR